MIHRASIVSGAAARLQRVTDDAGIIAMRYATPAPGES
jgi:hypothetical protein